MSVTQVALFGVDLATKDTFQGSGVEIAPGEFLTAGHVFLGPEKSADGTRIASGINSSFGVDTSGAIVTLPSASNPKTVITYNFNNTVTGFANISGYIPDLVTGAQPSHDTAAFTANPVGSPTGVVFFVKPTGNLIRQYFPTVNYGGFETLEAKNSTGTQVVVTQTPFENDGQSVVNISPGGQMFLTFPNTGDYNGISGGGVWGTINKTDYVLGTIVGRSGSNLAANYLTQSEFYSIFPLVAPMQNGTPSNIENLIIGSGTGGDQIRGSFQKSQILDSGDNNKILAGSNGDFINPDIFNLAA